MIEAFSASDESRQEIAENLGEKEGIVESIEYKYAFDYFYFLPDGEKTNWSIPYQAVDLFASIPKKDE